MATRPESRGSRTPEHTFGPVLRGRETWLRAVGSIERDQHTEDLVVTRGDRLGA
ncbi:hypothetical protein AB0B25_19460 [Nocardia sp. NPDC049190]|uniref:hypothetical protein n=1 Tax=Nocardia sp. NPDC049190 TaxID=3155650 RepID=UPI0033C02900